MLISLIVPCYNEEESMPLFYKEASVWRARWARATARILSLSLL